MPFRHEGILCMCPERSIWCCGRLLRLITTSEVGGIPRFDAFQDFVLCTMSSEDYQPWILLPPFKRPLRTHKFSASELKHRIYMCLLFSYPLILPGKRLYFHSCCWLSSGGQMTYYPLGFFCFFKLVL